jgi:hypothetical protein
MKTTLLHSPDRSQLRHDLFLIALGRRLALPLLFLGAALLAQPCAATPFQWEYTGSLNYVRADHTATLLSDGRVLVAGGVNYDNGGSLVPIAELYDPATGSWTLTGSLNTGRYDHTATLLTNGKVLVAGGGYGPLASAELYDPATGNWTFTGSLNEAREFHTATLLPDGKVLVAGGYNPHFVAAASAELYDPATGSWTVTGSLNNERQFHTATLLADGRVLVVGGNWYEVFASAELYDPATGSWTLTGSLNTARSVHTATLLTNGEVLVAGGYNNSGYIASAELYDPGIVAATHVDSRGAFDNQGNEVTFRFRVIQAGDSSTLGHFAFCDPAAGGCTKNGRVRSLSINGNTAEFSGQAPLEDGS